MKTLRGRIPALSTRSFDFHVWESGRFDDQEQAFWNSNGIQDDSASENVEVPKPAAGSIAKKVLGLLASPAASSIEFMKRFAKVSTAKAGNHCIRNPTTLRCFTRAVQSHVTW